MSSVSDVSLLVLPFKCREECAARAVGRVKSWKDETGFLLKHEYRCSEKVKGQD